MYLEYITVWLVAEVADHWSGVRTGLVLRPFGGNPSDLSRTNRSAAPSDPTSSESGELYPDRPSVDHLGCYDDHGRAPRPMLPERLDLSTPSTPSPDDLLEQEKISEAKKYRTRTTRQIGPSESRTKVQGKAILRVPHFLPILPGVPCVKLAETRRDTFGIKVSGLSFVLLPYG